MYLSAWMENTTCLQMLEAYNGLVYFDIIIMKGKYHVLTEMLEAYSGLLYFDTTIILMGICKFLKQNDDDHRCDDRYKVRVNLQFQ